MFSFPTSFPTCCHSTIPLHFTRLLLVVVFPKVILYVKLVLRKLIGVPWFAMNPCTSV